MRDALCWMLASIASPPLYRPRKSNPAIQIGNHTPACLQFIVPIRLFVDSRLKLVYFCRA